MPWHRHTSDALQPPLPPRSAPLCSPQPSPNLCCLQPQWEEAELHGGAASINTSYGTMSSSPYTEVLRCCDGPRDCSWGSQPAAGRSWGTSAWL